MKYVQIDLDQLGTGHVALVMFDDHGTLAGRLVERRPDGRLAEYGDATCQSKAFFQLFSTVLAKEKSDTIQVVITDGGFWPDQFPQLNRQP